MKKKLVFLIVFILACTIVFAGGKKESSSSSSSSDAITSDPVSSTHNIVTSQNQGTIVHSSSQRSSYSSTCYTITYDYWKTVDGVTVTSYVTISTYRNNKLSSYYYHDNLTGRSSTTYY